MFRRTSVAVMSGRRTGSCDRIGIKHELDRWAICLFVSNDDLALLY